MNLLRWNDFRLDEWAGRYDRLDSRVDKMDESLRDVVHDVTDIQKNITTTITTRTFRLMFLATILGPISTILAVVFTARGR